MDQIQEIKSRLYIVEVIREYLPTLKQSGSNWKALCPFHNEKTPSFMVSPEKQIWHCFGCGEGGDVFEFVKKIENVEFAEALRILANKAGVVLKKQDPKLLDKRARLLELLEDATKFFQAHLWQTIAGRQALDYLQDQRELAEQTIKDWRLGYAPVKRGALFSFLKKRGYTPAEMEEAGVVIGRGYSEPVDRFFDRIMFPLFDHQGQIVGFTGRLLRDKEGQGKYVNTPQTLLYNKSYVLYGLWQAKESMKDKGEVVVVEGQMDVLTAHQAGFKNTVASSGTALTSFHLDLLKRYIKKIIFAFDADQAGQQAIQKATDLALRQGFNIRVMVLPAGKDPDDFIRQQSQDFKQLLVDAPGVVEYFFDFYGGQVKDEDIKAKKEAAQKIVAVIKKLPDAIDQDFYIKKLAERFDISESALRELLHRSGSSQPDQIVEEVGGGMPLEQRISQRFLAWLIARYDFWDEAIQDILPEMVEGEKERDLYNQLIVYYTENNAVWGPEVITSGRLEKIFSSQPILYKLFETLYLLAQDLSVNVPDPYGRDDFRMLCRNLKDRYFRQQLNKLQKRLKEAEEKGQAAEVESLTEQINDILRKISQSLSSD